MTLGPALRAMIVVARRDFVSIVATPTFLLFLLAPLFMLAMSLAGGLGASKLADSARSAARTVALVDADAVEALRAADTRLRTGLGGSGAAPLLIRVTPAAPIDDAAVQAIAREGGSDTQAILTGPLDAPRIFEREPDSRAGRYLALLAAEARDGAPAVADPLAAARFTPLTARESSVAGRQSLAFGAVFILFLLTLLLAGQSVGMLAEEKGNKVIEILAAAAPLESVFLGKLLGMLGVALLFIAFWIALAIGGGLVAALVVDPGSVAGAGAQASSAALARTLATPATGWGFFLGVGFAYFIMSFLLLGAIFLGVGAQAGTVREIQMLSLPITIFQVAMFSLSSAAASAPGTRLARIVEWFPLSSPMGMAARAANDPGRAVHFAALAWQALWVVLIILVAVRLFRAGVLSGGASWRFWRRRAAPLTKL